MEPHHFLFCARPQGSSPTAVSTRITLTPMASVALARVYQQSFAAHPYFTLAVTNGALNAFGDAVAQVTQQLVRISVLFHMQYDVNLTLRPF